MALIGTIQIAMTTKLSSLQKGLSVGRSLLSSFGAEISGSAKLAEELNENIEKLDVIFGGASDVVIQQAEKMAEAFGTSKIKATDLAEKLGGMFKAQGIGEDASAEMTSQLLVLAQAMANFSHIPIEQALGKVRAGLAGRGKALAEYGIGINDVAVKNEALASGLATVGGKLDGAAKIQARFNLMMREGAGVIDQMGDRANDRSNAFTEFWGRIENIREEFGEKLPAPVESFFAQLNVGIVAASTAWNSWANTVITSQNDVSDWGQSSGQSIGAVQRAVGYLADSWQLLNGAFKLVQIGFNFLLQKISEGLSWLSKQLGVTDYFEAFADNMKSAVESEIQSLKDDWAKPWAHEGIDASFDVARKKTHELRQELASSAIAAGGLDPGKAAAMAKGHFKFAEAATQGSEKAYSIIAHSQFGNFDLQGKIAANSDKQTELLEDIRDHLSTVAENSDSSDIEPLGSF